MFRDNPLLPRLEGGPPLVGCWSHLVSPMAAEVVALCGYDFVLIDNEHGPASLSESTAIMQAVSGTGVATMMRVPWNDPVYIKRALDTGIEGLMIPAVEDAAAAACAVAACRYPPEGIRGVAYAVTRAADYGLKLAEYAEAANDNLVVMCQVETAKTVDNIAEIGAIEGIDVLFIGPFDLSASMGKAGRFDDPQVADTLARAEAAILATGKAMGGICRPDDGARAMLARGYKLLITNSDATLLRDAARAEVEALNSLRGV